MGVSGRMEEPNGGDRDHLAAAQDHIHARRGGRFEGTELSMALSSIHFSHALSFYIHISIDCNPPPNRLALFYFLNTVRIVQPLLRVELNVSPLEEVATTFNEPFVWSTDCQSCFENIVTQLRSLSSNGYTVRVYP